MRTLILLILVTSQCFGAFSYARSITVNTGQVTSGPHSNFPMLVSGTYTYLKVAGSGGSVQNASGYDVGFYSNSNCSTGKLPWETERWISTTGEVIYWVNVGSVNDGSVIYMCYGDASITTDQSNPTGVWDSSYLGVFHLPNGSTLSVADSTGLISATNSGASATTGGKIGGAASFNGTTNYINLGNNINPTSAITLSCWVYSGDLSTYRDAFSKSYTSTNPGDPPYHQWNLGTDPTAHAAVGVTIGGTLYGASTSGTMSTSTWYQIVGIYNGSALKIYLNGAEGGSTSQSGTMSTYATNAGIGASILRNSEHWNGRIDECRASNVARSAGYIATDYNSTNAPASFYTVGSEFSPSSGTRPRRIIIQ